MSQRPMSGGTTLQERGGLRAMTPIERLPGQLEEAKRRVARLERLQELLDKNPDMSEALDIIFEGGLY